jgi:hypothetical protein
MINQKTFNVKLIYNKVYSLVITGISTFTHWIEGVSIKFTITSILSLRIFQTSTIEMISGFIASNKALSKLQSDVNNNFEFMVSYISSILKISTDINHKMYLNISVPYAKLLSKFYTSIIEVLSLQAEGTVASRIDLSVYDPQTLGTLDLLTLGEMDSVIIPP